MKRVPALELFMLHQIECLAPARVRLAISKILLGWLVVSASTVSVASAVTEEPRLRDLWPAWLEAVTPLITIEERQAFDKLDSERERERFVVDFWQRRPESTLARWNDNRRASIEARHRAPVKRRVIQALGKPDHKTVFDRCLDQLRRIEIWHYEPWQIRYQLHASGQGADLAGNATPAEPFTIAILEWSNLDPRRAEVLDPGIDLERWGYGQALPTLGAAIDLAVDSRCLRPGDRDAFESALDGALSLKRALERVPWPEPAPMATARTDPEGWPRARLRIEPIGAHGSQTTILRGTLSLPTTELALSPTGLLVERITIIGDLRRGGRFESSFAISHLLSGAPPSTERVNLDFFRSLRPGTYDLDLRVTDHFDRPLLRERREIDIPKMDAQAEPPPERSGGFSRLTRSDLVLMTTFPSLQLLEPRHPGTESSQVLIAVTQGGPIGSVEFSVDGELHSRDAAAPYSIELETSTRARTVDARALDPSGRTLASASRVILPAGRPFTLHLERGESPEAPLPLTIELPEGETLRTVRCFEGQRLVATLPLARRAGPQIRLQCPVLRSSSGFRYARALAELESGAQTEDVLVLSNRALEEVDVQIAQLAVSVVDGDGAPIQDLRQEELEVTSRGRALEIVRFETVERLPLHLTLLLDTSSSMGRRLRLTSQSSQSFFEDLLRPQDAASLVAFNHDIRVLVPFTSDQQYLRYGASELSAWGSTRLYDGIMHSLTFFDGQRGESGQKGRRALVVLTDGADVGSDATPAMLEQELIRSGIALYAVSLGRLAESDDAELTNLARLSGGALFHARSPSQLDQVFERIDTLLRSQYLITVEPGEPASEQDPVSFDVVVARSGARVTALARLR